MGRPTTHEMINADTALRYFDYVDQAAAAYGPNIGTDPGSLDRFLTLDANAQEAEVTRLAILAAGIGEE